MKPVEGEVTVPVTKLVFTVGEGRRIIRYSVRISAERKDDGFAVILRVDRLGAVEIAGLLVGPLIVAGLIGYHEPEALPFVLPFLLLVVGFRAVYVWRHTAEVAEAFAVPYLALPRVRTFAQSKRD